MVIAYLRVSTGKQHLENQEMEICRYSQMKGLTIDRWITETVSGKTDRNDRRLGKVIRKLTKGDTLIVTELSRLSRSLHEIMLIMKLCIDNDVVIHSTKDGFSFDDSLNSKVLSFAFGLAAEIEHKLISQRTREAISVQRAAGRHVGRKYGTDVRIRLLENKKSAILLMIKRGCTLASICQKYNVGVSTFRRFRMRNSEVDELIRRRRKGRKMLAAD